MKVYIAGPMTGKPDLNRPAFGKAALRLLALRHVVFNPAARDGRLSYREYLASDLAWICTHAEALYLLEGWDESPGARAEAAVGEALGLKMMFDDDDDYDHKVSTTGEGW